MHTYVNANGDARSLWMCNPHQAKLILNSQCGNSKIIQQGQCDGNNENINADIQSTELLLEMIQTQARQPKQVK